MAIRKVGKKGRAWVKARAKLIKEAVAEGRIEIIDGMIQGICEDCRRWKPLTPDHIIKRSQGGGHDKKNIAWVCIRCHDKRDNQPMSKKSKKPNWKKEHKCKHCKKLISMLLCPFCRKISV